MGQSKLKSILIIIDYFGEWPPWFPLFLESCRRNPTINWLFNTDCSFEAYSVDNVKFKRTNFDDYVEKISEKLKINFNPENSYKLCDIRPMYGIIHSEEIAEFDFYGYGDLDVIYGNIRNFYTEEVLENNVVSTHAFFISGHLALFRNVKWIRNAFRRIRNWKAKLEHPKSQRFDEDVFSTLFRYPGDKQENNFWYDVLHPCSRRYRRNLFLKEQFTTPLTPLKWRRGQARHPEIWFWKDGTLTNENDRTQECIYLHFMNYVSARWMDPLYNTHPSWKSLDKFVFATPEEMSSKGVRIDRAGFHSMA